MAFQFIQFPKRIECLLVHVTNYPFVATRPRGPSSFFQLYGKGLGTDQITLNILAITRTPWSVQNPSRSHH